MDYWFDLGVDGMRLDAIPYLYERPGTNCENLPETHTVIKRIRADLDREYAGRMILAEANQPPQDVRSYFGAGDECHMAFHFPLMPRLFMALRLEDRHPVTDIMNRTPVIPEPCQWALFIRNHDELTLEMVTDEERDYMYLAYGLDPRMRLNVGIRRRLAPLMENNRRRIELLNSILLSFPGTPIVYYGDELGMGDNIYLGDRHGVRTPMQWSADRNAGFSRANPARLYSPVIMDAVYGYEVINVEAQLGDPSSLLHWTKHMIALRKLFKGFGRGSIEFLSPVNRKILAYIRSHDGEQILCVANLSRFAQPFELDLSAHAGRTPVEMLGYVEFPRIGRNPYPLTLGPYGFLWFELHGQTEAPEVQAAPPGEPMLALRGTEAWLALLQPVPRSVLESRVLPEYLPKQGWFEGKTGSIRACRLVHPVPLSATAGIAVVEVEYAGEPAESYLLTLAIATGQVADAVRAAAPGAVLCGLRLNDQAGVLCDAMARDAICREIERAVAHGEVRRGDTAALRGQPGQALGEVREPEGGWTVLRPGTDQGFTSVRFGDQLILKLFRRVVVGPHPDAEMTRYLTECTGFTGVPGFAGALEFVPDGLPAATVGMLQRLVHHQGDGWRWMLDELSRVYERAATLEPPGSLPPHPLEAGQEGLSPSLDDLFGISDDAAATLGRRTAELHLALARPTENTDFAPEPMTTADLAGLATEIRQDAAHVFASLKKAIPGLPDDLVELASRVLSYRRRVATRLDRLLGVEPGLLRIRVHGEYDLTRVLRVGLDFLVIGFRGDPSRPPADRGAKQTPLRDVAGMLRSFAYASQAALQAHVARRPSDLARLQRWAEVWDRSVCGIFLQAYHQAAAGAPFLPTTAEGMRYLTDALLLEKMLRELRHELDHRPAWLRVPLLGLLALEGDEEGGRLSGGASSERC
jgi:maltose alpha-D-glucosyltransferase/alpha-amylase